MLRLPVTSLYCVTWRSLALRVVEGVAHADARHRGLLDAVDDLRLGDADRFEDRRDDVDEVVYCRRISPLALMPLGQCTTMPGHVAAAVGHLDAPGRGRGAGHRPGHGVVRVGLRPAVLVQAAQQVRDVLRRAVERRPLDEHAVDLADRRAAVVAGDVDEQGVVQLAQVVDGVDQAADLVVGALRPASRRPPSAGRRPSSRRPTGCPSFDVLGVLGELGVGRDDAHLASAAPGSPRAARPSPGRTRPCRGPSRASSSAACAAGGRRSASST